VICFLCDKEIEESQPVRRVVYDITPAEGPRRERLIDVHFNCWIPKHLWKQLDADVAQRHSEFLGREGK
jgi:hypothetical protein